MCVKKDILENSNPDIIINNFVESSDLLNSLLIL